MKPMHAIVCSISRCPCCQSKYSARSQNKKNTGKSAARQIQKKELRSILNAKAE